MSAAPTATNKKLAKRTFNAVACALFGQLSKIFPGDPKLLFLEQETASLARDRTMDHVPAMSFFKAMNQSTGLPSLANPMSGDAVVGELVVTGDGRLFAPDCKAEVPQLDALDLKGKWVHLSAENRKFVWGYLQRMAQLSARVATLETMDSMGPAAMQELTAALTKTAAAGGTPADMLNDPGVAEIAERLTTKLGLAPQ
jgi:hypothetical protein